MQLTYIFNEWKIKKICNYLLLIVFTEATITLSTRMEIIFLTPSPRQFLTNEYLITNLKKIY